MAVGPSAPARADSSCAVLVGELGGSAYSALNGRQLAPAAATKCDCIHMAFLPFPPTFLS